MHRRSIIRGGVTALFALTCLASAFAQQRTYPSDSLCKREQLCRYCNEPACMKVATPAAWPEGRVEEGTGPFIMGVLFKVLFPKGASAFLVLADGDMLVKYGSDRWIGVQVLTAAEAHRPQWDGQKSIRPNALTFADIPRIEYTKTPEDAEPSNVEDRRVWRYALTNKGRSFKSATQMIVVERGSLTAYLSDANLVDDTVVAYITHRRLKGSYLQVQAKGFSFDDIRNVVGSIEAMRE